MGADTGDDSQVLSFYRRYIGEPGRPVDVYAGFALFFGGIALASVGLLLFLWSATLPSDATRFWQLREIAITLAAVGLPAFVLSVVVLLPVSRRVEFLAGAGATVCLVAIGVFIWAYPSQWNVTRPADYSAQGISIYAGGLAGLVAATGSALVAHHIERRSAAAPESESEAASATAEPDETVTRAQVERDIDEALSNTELTWGGVERERDPRRLRLKTPEVEDIATAQSEASANTARSEGVDDAVAGLRQLQGGGPKQASSEAVVDDQTAALRELRERQREAADDESGISARLRRLLGSR